MELIEWDTLERQGIEREKLRRGLELNYGNVPVTRGNSVVVDKDVMQRGKKIIWFSVAMGSVIRERSPKTKMKTSTSFVREMSGTSLLSSSSYSRNLKL